MHIHAQLVQPAGQRPRPGVGRAAQPHLGRQHRRILKRVHASPCVADLHQHPRRPLVQHLVRRRRRRRAKPQPGQRADHQQRRGRAGRLLLRGRPQRLVCRGAGGRRDGVGGLAAATVAAGAGRGVAACSPLPSRCTAGHACDSSHPKSRPAAGRSRRARCRERPGQQSAGRLLRGPTAPRAPRPARGGGGRQTRPATGGRAAVAGGCCQGLHCSCGAFSGHARLWASLGPPIGKSAAQLWLTGQAASAQHPPGGRRGRFAVRRSREEGPGLRGVAACARGRGRGVGNDPQGVCKLIQVVDIQVLRTCWASPSASW